MDWNKHLLVKAKMGSYLYGTAEEKSDHDYLALFVEPPEKILGIDGLNSEEVKTKTGDLVLHSLQKWAALAAKGNPTVLELLFTQPEWKHPVWDTIAVQRQKFLAKRHLTSFLGYANAQRKKLGDTGDPYDGKFAAHILRLYYEAEELMKTGALSFPSPHAKFLLEVKHNEHKLERVLALARDLEGLAIAARLRSKLPEFVDRDEISRIIALSYQQFWAAAAKQVGVLGKA